MPKFNFYQDPGHGWVKVSKKLLKDLGIDEKITSYSYMRGEHAYLEEDLDLTTFMDAMEKAGKPVNFNEFHTNRSSKIRGYDAYLRYWYTKELQEDFEVIFFLAPMVRVRRKESRKLGYMTFNHKPRYYFNFEEIK